MNKYTHTNHRLTWRTLIWFSILAAISLAHAPLARGPVAVEQPSSECLLCPLYDAYFYKTQRGSALDSLSRLIFAGKIRLTPANLQDTILYMLNDYFTRVDDPVRFEEIIYHCVNPACSTQMKNYFLGSALHRYATQAIARWTTPARIELSPRKCTLPIDSTRSFEISAFNGVDSLLKNVSLVTTLAPPECGRIDYAEMAVTALRPGSATLRVASPANERAQAEASIVIPEPPTPLPPPPGPIIRTLSRYLAGPGAEIIIDGENFSGPDENIKIAFGTTPARPLAVSTTRLVAKVPELASSKSITVPVKVRTVYGEATAEGQLTIEPRPKYPSLLRPALSSGACLTAAAAYLVLKQTASNRYDKYENHFIYIDHYKKSAESDALFDSYLSGNRLKNVCGILTASSVMATLYFWIDYVKDRGRYKGDMARLYGPVEVRAEAGYQGLSVTWRF